MVILNACFNEPSDNLWKRNTAVQSGTGSFGNNFRFHSHPSMLRVSKLNVQPVGCIEGASRLSAGFRLVAMQLATNPLKPNARLTMLMKERNYQQLFRTWEIDKRVWEFAK